MLLTESSPPTRLLSSASLILYPGIFAGGATGAGLFPSDLAGTAGTPSNFGKVACAFSIFHLRIL